MKGTGLIGVAILGVCLALGVLVFSILDQLSGSGDGTGPVAAEWQAELAAQKAETDGLRRELAGLGKELEAVKSDLAELSARPAANTELIAPAIGDLEFEEGAIPATEALSEQMKLAKERFNKGIIQPKNAFMQESLGQPRESYATDCQGVTNPRLEAALETREIGNFRLKMLRPALDSVQRIMERLQSEEPEIYGALGTAGGLCARFIRGSTTSISNHSWGAAVDLTLEGNLDAMGDGGTQAGLVILAEYFNDEGWYWGAGYGREDSMHFEVGEDLLRRWVAEGKL